MVELFVDKKTPVIKNSDFLKIVVAGYYRYAQGFKYTTTEFHHQDVTACDGDYFYEIECKISKADLKNEAKQKTKKEKHNKYRNYSSKKWQYTPNKFYFAITPEMAEDKDCLDFIGELNPKYGIIVCYSWNKHTCIKSAKFLHNDKIKPKVKEEIVARLSSENINQRIDLYKLKYCT